MKTREKYADIIDLPRPQSKRPRMSAENRAAQFAPFAALTGYHESVEETEAAHTSANETGGVEFADEEDVWIS
ncbi:MAG: hypothetical protein IKQ97_01640 [Eubacterium sp.]|nr:hypothetical protein [Eubacterium sp.]